MKQKMFSHNISVGEEGRRIRLWAKLNINVSSNLSPIASNILK